MFLKNNTVRYVLISAVVVGVLGMAVLGVARVQMNRHLDNMLSHAAQTIAAQTLAAQPADGDSTSIAVPSPINGLYTQIWQPGDEMPVLAGASTGIAIYETPLDKTTVIDSAGIQTLSEPHYRTITTDDAAMRVLTYPIQGEGGTIAVVQVAADLTTFNSMIGVLRIGLLVGGVGLVAVIGGLSAWIVMQTLKPVRDITEAAARITATNDLKSRLDWRGTMQEMGHLTSVFNQLMDRIEYLFNVQQQFITDISHELRTPLTTIQGNVELMRLFGVDPESLTAIETESKRMTRLVSDMLMLARADYGGLQIDLYPVDFDSVVKQTLEQARTLAQNRHLSLTLRRCDPVCIQGNIDHLKQGIMNLLDNAVKYTPEGGHVVVDLHQVEDSAILRVSDTGIGIAQGHLNRVFDRFFQADTARVYNPEGNFGLGLSVTQWIVKAHGGKIGIYSQPGNGTTVTLILPRHVVAGIRPHHTLTEKKDVRRITNELSIVQVNTSPAHAQENTGVVIQQ